MSWWWRVVDANHQYRGVQVIQPPQQQQLTSSNVVYVQVPAGDVRPPGWNGRHYLRAQSLCLGSVLVIAGSLSVVCNVVMAVSYTGMAAWYLTRVIMCAIMVRIRPHVVPFLGTTVGLRYVASWFTELWIITSVKLKKHVYKAISQISRCNAMNNDKMS